MSNDALIIDSLDVSYSGMQVLRGFSLRVDRGRIVGLVGESGSGKSTLLHAAMGTLPPCAEITGGSVTLGGRDLLALSKEEARAAHGAEISMVFQNHEMQLCPVVRIGRHFQDVLKAHGRYDKDGWEAMASQALERCGLADPKRVLGSYSFELSGGMCQRVCLALASILGPSFLLADEPTSALDVVVQAQVMEQLRRMRDELGMGVLLVTHNIGVVAQLADVVGVCYSGQLVELGEASDVLFSPLHPYTRALLEATPRMDGELPRGLDGRPPSFDDEICGCRFAERCARSSEDCCEEGYVLSAPHPGDDKGHWCACPKTSADADASLEAVRP